MNILKPLGAALALVLAISGPVHADAPERIVFVRHGEKPPLGLGQLDCQGLNRALALPPVIAALIGRPAAIFAPDPAAQKRDGGIAYDYVRPLATVEPTAIALGLPVHADLAVDDIVGLQQALEQPAYRQASILVGWEHHLIDEAVRRMVAAHGGPAGDVPNWRDDDYDSIYLVRLAWTGGGATARFEVAHEGLNGQPTACPH